MSIILTCLVIFSCEKKETNPFVGTWENYDKKKLNNILDAAENSKEITLCSWKRVQMLMKLPPPEKWLVGREFTIQQATGTKFGGTLLSNENDSSPVFSRLLAPIFNYIALAICLRLVIFMCRITIN